MGRRLFALSTRGTRPYGEIKFRFGDVFVFGAQTNGLPPKPASCSRPGGRSSLGGV